MHVAPTIAAVQNGEFTTQIHDDLAAMMLAPAEHALGRPIEDGQRRYPFRAGIEATLSRNVRTCSPRQNRYLGLPKNARPARLTSLACNVTRVADWIARPTRDRRAPSHFHGLCSAAI